jgi:hypothetical protein
MHGTGAADPLPEWTRFVSGMEDGGNPAIIHISSTLLLAGAHSTGANGAIIDIPANDYHCYTDFPGIEKLDYRR